VYGRAQYARAPFGSRFPHVGPIEALGSADAGTGVCHRDLVRVRYAGPGDRLAALAKSQCEGSLRDDLVSLVVFALVERRATDPILPLRLFTSSVFNVCVILAFIVGFSMLGAMRSCPPTCNT